MYSSTAHAKPAFLPGLSPAGQEISYPTKRLGERFAELQIENCTQYRNRNPFFTACPGMPSLSATAPSTTSPRSSLLFNLTRMKRRTVAAQMAMNAVEQLAAKATTGDCLADTPIYGSSMIDLPYRGPAEVGYI